MNNKITRWWLSLDPTNQYIYWIIAFCAMLTVGIGIIVVAVEHGLAGTIILPILFSIGAFVIFFLFIVLWLTIRWPNIRNHDN